MDVVFAPDFMKSMARCFRSRWHPKEIWYRFKCWAWKRYTTVKPRWLDHTWCDRCELLPCMMFEILGQFIEKECSPGYVEWYGENGHKIEVDGKMVYVRDEMDELWKWWCEVYVPEDGTKYPNSYQGRNDVIWEEIHKLDEASLISHFKKDEERGLTMFDPQYKNAEDKDRVKHLFKQLNAIEAEQHAELEARMHRLVRIRPYLWT